VVWYRAGRAAGLWCDTCLYYGQQFHTTDRWSPFTCSAGVMAEGPGDIRAARAGDGRGPYVEAVGSPRAASHASAKSRPERLRRGVRRFQGHSGTAGTVSHKEPDGES